MFQIFLRNPFIFGNIGQQVRFNQFFTYDSNVVSLPEELSDARDSAYSDSQFLYKRTYSYTKGITHAPEIRLKYKRHFERNIPSIYQLHGGTVGPVKNVVPMPTSIRKSDKEVFYYFVYTNHMAEELEKLKNEIPTYSSQHKVVGSSYFERLEL